MSAGSARVNDPFRNPLVIEVSDFFRVKQESSSSVGPRGPAFSEF